MRNTPSAQEFQLHKHGEYLDDFLILIRVFAHRFFSFQFLAFPVFWAKKAEKLEKAENPKKEFFKKRCKS